MVSEDGYVTKMQATDLAAKFISSRYPVIKTKANSKIASTETIFNDKNNSEVLMYVINYIDGGFVIVSATKNYYPILAYSNEGSFILRGNDKSSSSFWINETKEALIQSKFFNDSLKLKMNKLWANYGVLDKKNSVHLSTKSYNNDLETAFQNRITELQNEFGSEYSFYRLSEVFENGAFPDTYSAYQHYCNLANGAGSPLDYTIVGLKGAYELNEVGPLMSTHWHQEDPFNAECLNFPAAAGCGIIAIAQIMKFHEFPTNYSWSNMPNTYPTNSTQYLIREINYILGCDSKSSVYEERDALEGFGYNATIYFHNEESVKNELLTNQRPILMGGFYDNFLGLPLSGSGHTWVCDGVSHSYNYMSYFIDFYVNNNYSSIENVPSIENPNIVNGVSTLYFHMNWGWGQSYNAWYVSNDVASPGGNFQYWRKNIYISK